MGKENIKLQNYISAKKFGSFLSNSTKKNIKAILIL
jgi:hypothetical protein